MMQDAVKAFVLDTSALVCLREKEPGAKVVEQLLRDHGAQGDVFICFISLMEFFYIVHQEQGGTEARRAYLQLKQLPLEIIESDEDLAVAAGRIKAEHRLSVADAWIAATAERLKATLVHKDPEFESLSKTLALQPLPYKPKKA